MARQSKSGRAAAKSARALKRARKGLAPKRKTAEATATPKTRGDAKLRVKAAPKPKPKPAPKSRSASKAKPKAARARTAKRRALAKTKAKVKPRALRPSARPLETQRPQSLMNRLEAQALEVQTGRDWSATLFLPKTDFPMKAGLPEREPELLKRWHEIRLYDRLREEAMGRPKFILHDGPPYANGNIHIGTGLNKILKDLINRSQAMMGKDASYVPGWDCHGLPIEWKVEEENYRAKGKAKPDLSDSAAMIAQELMKFAMNGLLYRGSKPVMWSVIEQTALAEAEVEYAEIESPAIWVKFPVESYSGTSHNIGPDDDEVLIPAALTHASIVIWTTTPWTIPGNRAVAFSRTIDYGLYQVMRAPEENWAKTGDRLILADKLADEVFKSARVEGWKRLGHVPWSVLDGITLAHPLRGRGYDFDVPLLAGEHVTEDAGTGFVHTAPGHGTEDFEIWMEHRRELADSGVDTTIPYTV